MGRKKWRICTSGISLAGILLTRLVCVCIEHGWLATLAIGRKGRVFFRATHLSFGRKIRKKRRNKKSLSLASWDGDFSYSFEGQETKWRKGVWVMIFHQGGKGWLKLETLNLFLAGNVELCVWLCVCVEVWPWMWWPTGVGRRKIGFHFVSLEMYTEFSFSRI